MVRIDKAILELWKEDKDLKVKYDYYNKFKEEPLGHLINGPDISAYDNDPDKVNKAAIEQNVIWQKLLGWEQNWKEYRKMEKDKDILI